MTLHAQSMADLRPDGKAGRQHSWSPAESRSTTARYARYTGAWRVIAMFTVAVSSSPAPPSSVNSASAGVVPVGFQWQVAVRSTQVGSVFALMQATSYPADLPGRSSHAPGSGSPPTLPAATPGIGCPHFHPCSTPVAAWLRM